MPSVSVFVGGNLLAEGGRSGSEERAGADDAIREWEVARRGATNRFVTCDSMHGWWIDRGLGTESPGEWGAAHEVAAGESPFPGNHILRTISRRVSTLAIDLPSR